MPRQYLCIRGICPRLDGRRVCAISDIRDLHMIPNTCLLPQANETSSDVIGVEGGTILTEEQVRATMAGQESDRFNCPVP